MFRKSIIAGLTALSLNATAAVVEFESGTTMYVPEAGWEVIVQPKGLNSQPYHRTHNPSGKLPGWEGWPKYNLKCPTPSFSPIPAACNRPNVEYFAPADADAELYCDFDDLNCDGRLDYSGPKAGLCYDREQSTPARLSFVDC